MKTNILSAFFVLGVSGLFAAGQTGWLPGESLNATCSGRWANVTTGASSISADCVEVQRSNIVIDHTSLSGFNSLSSAQIDAAARMRLMFVNRSVGWNISQGLDCLQYASDEAAPYVCKKYQHEVPEFSSSPQDVNWTRSYSRANWQFYGWPGTGITPTLPCGLASAGYWYQYLDCFIRYVDGNAGRHDVVSFQIDYLGLQEHSDILSSTQGFFVRGQENRADVGDLDALIARHPTKVFVIQTTSLARSIGSQVSTEFNDRLRAYAAERSLPLLDIADIEAHAPDGTPCYDDRDGVPYRRLNGQSENYPDDGLNLPAICQHYTPEVSGGHIGNPASGYIRTAKAWWLLMARVAGQ